MTPAKKPNGPSINLDWPSIRQFLLHNVGDTLAYTKDAEAASPYTQIYDVVDQTAASAEAAAR